MSNGIRNNHRQSELLYVPRSRNRPCVPPISERSNPEESELCERAPPKQYSPEKINPDDSSFNLTNTTPQDTLNMHLSSIGLPEYIDMFRQNQIMTLHDLTLVTRRDLIEMEIPIQHRAVILSSIKDIKADEEHLFANSPSFSPIKQQLTEDPSDYALDKESSYRRAINDEVESFMNEVQVMSRRSSQTRTTNSSSHSRAQKREIYENPRPQKREIIDSQSRAAAGDAYDIQSRAGNGEVYDMALITQILKDISLKQEIMMEKIEENSQRINQISAASSRTRRSKSPEISRKQTTDSIFNSRRNKLS